MYKSNDATGLPERQNVFNQACNHKRMYCIYCFVKIVGYFDKNDKIIWS